MSEKVGVVLLNLGGPDSLEAVEPFLFNLFNDPEIINFPLSFLFRKRLAKLISSKRHPRIQEQYKEIGGKSPLLELSEVQARLLEERLAAAGVDAKVYLAMRYWKPFTEDAIAAIERDGIERVVLLPLYPQFSKSTTGSSVKEWNRLIAERPHLRDIKTDIVEHYYEYPTYLDAVIDRIEQGLDRFPEHLRDEVHILFSAHGTPMKLVREGDPYSGHICETVCAVRERGGWKNPHTLCFQSKVGPQKWLTPSTPKVIEELADAGTTHMLAVPIAFVSDHLETLFEIGKEFRHLASEKGVEQFEVTEGLNDSAIFADALAELVFDKIGHAEAKAA
ncbi:MAG: ferrochelatase [Pyrinomonadaceae bacterium]|nr:ferrochelatase [Pyrinomonadaceae bacterium]